MSRNVRNYLIMGLALSLLFLMFSLTVIVPAPVHAETISNEQIGELTVFHQNYSVQGITDNIFPADPLVHTCIANYTLSYNNEKKAVEFHTWQGNTYYLYIGKLYPAVQTKYYITLDYDYGNWNDKLYIHFPFAWLIVQKYDDGTFTLRFNRYADNGTVEQTNYVGIQYEGIIPLIVEWNGVNKTVHITLANNNTVSIWQDSTYSEVRNLPYPELSGTYVCIINLISSYDPGTGMHTYLYELKQTIPRYTITALPRNNLQAFGFDKPCPWNTVQNGFKYLDEKGYRATIFFDINAEWASNATVKQYLQNYINNKSWEVGIHYTHHLTDGYDSLASVYENMTKEYNQVKDNFSAPLTFCSLGNRDNVTHAQYAYSNLGMLWRNAKGSGIKSIPNIGGLNDNHWHFWDIASQHGFVYPCFAHETDLDPAIDYSISWSKFTTWVDRAKEHGIQIIPFAEYYYINANQHDFYATNIQKGDGYLKFTAHTNSYKAYVDVAYTPTANTIVKDLTTGKIINWQKGSVQFWVEDGHTYEIYNITGSTSSGSTPAGNSAWYGWLFNTVRIGPWTVPLWVLIVLVTILLSLVLFVL
ncbi:MAG: hypothetical protein DRN17_07625, partial [Thermoplasmata archaeon]